MDSLDKKPVAFAAANDTDTETTVADIESASSGSLMGRIDILQLVFWGCLLMSIAAASVALAWPSASGTPGPILLTAMGSGGLVFLLWSVRGAGRVLGLFPERGSAARHAQTSAPRFGWIEALDESVLIADQGGAPVAANTAYHDLTALALMVPQSDNAPVTVDRLFGANPGLAAPVYRLSKSAKAGQARREVLPPLTMGPKQVPAQFEIGVSPLPRGRVLWRIRRIAGSQEATGATDLKSLYVEDAPMGFFAARPDGTLTYANNWLRELLGLPESARNIRIDDIMRPEFVKMLSRDRKSGAPGRADIQLRARDGVEVPVQAITSWSGRGAEAAGRTIILASQQVLSGQDERFTLNTASRPPRPDGDPMFDDSPFGAVRLEGDSVQSAIIMDANRALMEMTDGQAQPGQKFSSLFVADEGQDDLNEKLVDAIDKPRGMQIAGQEPRHANVFITLDGNGRPAVAYILDITEQRQLEMRLAHGEKMQAIGQLAGGVAHDFNNVLQGIILNNEELMVAHPVGDPSYGNLKSIHEFSIRAKDLVKMLLAYARQQTFKREIFAVTDFLSEFSILLRQLLDERVELEVVHGRDVPHIKADKNQLENALFNLANNARDAMLSHKNGGKLTIRTARATGAEAHAKGFAFVADGEYMLIEVEDTGHGMPKDVMDKIFQPFFTTKAPGVGTGLGLATVYGIIKQSGGYVCTTSAVGKGTTFHIYLPALQASDVPAPIEIAPEKKAARPMDISGRGRILLIEDEDGVRGIAASLLRSRGYEVEEACDGEQAMEILEEKPASFDLVISDVVMPGKDGPTLIREAKDLLGHARVIFISGYAERDLAQQLDDDRAVSFLPKPFTVRQLAERVKQELGNPNAEAA